jgi:hypothetical protein
MDQGQFQVVRDSVARRQQVVNYQGMPVVDVTAGWFTVVQMDSLIPARHRERYKASRGSTWTIEDRKRAGPWILLGESEDPGTRLTEEQFLATVRSFPVEPEKPERPSAPADSGGLLRTR